MLTSPGYFWTCISVRYVMQTLQNITWSSLQSCFASVPLGEPAVAYLFAWWSTLLFIWRWSLHCRSILWLVIYEIFLLYIVIEYVSWITYHPYVTSCWCWPHLDTFRPAYPSDTLCRLSKILTGLPLSHALHLYLFGFQLSHTSSPDDLPFSSSGEGPCTVDLRWILVSVVFFLYITLFLVGLILRGTCFLYWSH